MHDFHLSRRALLQALAAAGAAGALPASRARTSATHTGGPLRTPRLTERHSRLMLASSTALRSVRSSTVILSMSIVIRLPTVPVDQYRAEWRLQVITLTSHRTFCRTILHVCYWREA